MSKRREDIYRCGDGTYYHQDFIQEKIKELYMSNTGLEEYDKGYDGAILDIWDVLEFDAKDL